MQVILLFQSLLTMKSSETRQWPLMLASASMGSSLWPWSTPIQTSSSIRFWARRKMHLSPWSLITTSLFNTSWANRWNMAKPFMDWRDWLDRTESTWGLMWSQAGVKVSFFQVLERSLYLGIFYHRSRKTCSWTQPWPNCILYWKNRFHKRNHPNGPTK